jgi:hypothetical protein
MRKSLHVLIAVVAFALMGSIVFAYAPVIKPLPDVYIGDAEDNVGTVDINMFRFSDALNLDDYVSDQDSTISELVWSFYEGGPDNLEINGIMQLADPGDAINADLLGKDIRHAAAPYDDDLIDFWDELDSPRASGPPWPDPTSPLNEIVTFFVSDGLYVDSDQMKVEAVDDGFDQVSPVTVWEEVIQYDFEGDQDGWIFVGVAANAQDSQFAAATSAYTGSGLGVITDDSTNRYGFWFGPAVPFESGKLFKFAWNVRTTQVTPELVPTVRFRVGDQGLTYSNTMSLLSDGVTNPNAPDTTGKVYNQLILPPGTSSSPNMTPSFDVYDFSSDIGTVVLEQLDVFKTDVPASGWASETIPALTTWVSVSGPGVYSAVTTGTSGGLQLGSTAGNDFHYGFWGVLDAGVAMTADTMYRAVFSISSSDTGLPDGMVRVNSTDLQVAYRLTFYDAIGPDVDGEDYAIYLESHDTRPAPADTFGLYFELSDFSATAGGTMTLTDVAVDSMAALE